MLARRYQAHRLMALGIERLPDRIDELESIPLDDARELAQRELHAAAKARVVATLDRETALEIVDHGEEIGQQLFIGEAARLFEVALQALPLVFELGALPQHDFAHLGELRFVLEIGRA